MRVLVTGATGYIGRIAVPVLARAGHDVACLVRAAADLPASIAGQELAIGDVRDRERMFTVIRRGRFEGIVHLAGLTKPNQSTIDAQSFHDVNVVGTRNLIEAFSMSEHPAATPRPFVFSSTYLVYGGNNDGPVREDTRLIPTTPYAKSKVDAETILIHHCRSSGITPIVFRLANVGGAAEGSLDLDRSHIIPALLDAVAKNELFDLYADATEVRDFVHVADVTTALRAALEHPPSHSAVVNIGSGVGTSMTDLLRCVESVTGSRVVTCQQPRVLERKQLLTDICLAARTFSWYPQRSAIHTIVADTWQFRPVDGG